MPELEIKLSPNIAEAVKHLAVRHYGDSTDVSIGRVAEVALELRLLWQERVEGVADDIEEPIANWEFADRRPAEELPGEIRNWLFRRG